MKRSLSLVGLVAVTLLSTGCFVSAAPAPVTYVEVEAPPPNIDSSPQTVYEGRTVYYTSNRWYYRHGNHWRYYRHEPPPLRRQRQPAAARPYVQEAPPAPRQYPPPAVQTR